MQLQQTPTRQTVPQPSWNTNPEKNLKNGPVFPAIPFVGKILPPQLREHTLFRRRLLDLLHRGIERRIVTITAPAGYGKTTLAATFLRDAELPACWYSLDGTDGDPR